MNYAYVTLATNVKYLHRALYLQASLERVNSKYPLIILISKDLLKYKLINDVKHYKIIDIINFSTTESIVRYKFTLNKFHIFNLVEYDKILFLDADMFILTNIDVMFEKTEGYDCVYSKYVTGRYGTDEALPRGGFFTCIPKEGFFEEILNNDAFNNLLHYDDEHILKEICFPKWKTATFEELHLLDKTMPICFHGKWHMHYPSINYKNMINMSDKDILEFFQKELKRKTLSYLRNRKVQPTKENFDNWCQTFWDRQFLFDIKEKIL